MRTLFLLCSFLCVSAVNAESQAQAEPSPSGKPVTRIVQIETEEDLIAYQALMSLKKPRINLSQPGLAMQVAVIEKHIKEGITFSELSGSELRKVQTGLKTFSKMGREIGESTSYMQFTPQHLAEQDKLNFLLDKAQKDSVFECYSTQTTGSHFIVRKCRTVAQLRRMRDRDQNSFMRRVENKFDAARLGSNPGAAAMVGSE